MLHWLKTPVTSKEFDHFIGGLGGGACILIAIINVFAAEWKAALHFGLISFGPLFHLWRAYRNGLLKPVPHSPSSDRPNPGVEFQSR